MRDYEKAECNATVTKVRTNDYFVRISLFVHCLPEFPLSENRSNGVPVRNGICDRGISSARENQNNYSSFRVETNPCLSVDLDEEWIFENWIRFECFLPAKKTSCHLDWRINISDVTTKLKESTFLKLLSRMIFISICFFFNNRKYPDKNNLRQMNAPASCVHCPECLLEKEQKISEDLQNQVSVSSSCISTIFFPRV